jgi:hypothetical protein
VEATLEQRVERLKARMGWAMPWYTITDDFDTDFSVDEWHGTNAFMPPRAFAGAALGTVQLLRDRPQVGPRAEVRAHSSRGR